MKKTIFALPLLISTAFAGQGPADGQEETKRQPALRLVLNDRSAAPNRGGTLHLVLRLRGEEPGVTTHQPPLPVEQAPAERSSSQKALQSDVRQELPGDCPRVASADPVREDTSSSQSDAAAGTHNMRTEQGVAPEEDGGIASALPDQSPAPKTSNPSRKLRKQRGRELRERIIAQKARNEALAAQLRSRRQ